MDNGRPWGQDPPRSYALTGKIMLSAIVILFAVVVFIVVLHLYARWYLLRRRQRSIPRRRSRRQRAAHVVFYVDPNNHDPAVSVLATRGLDASVLRSLPVFSYSSRTHPAALECAVCLSEFEEGENGRVLPKCQHSFHIDCIDMWFQSHSTCPICRSPVEPQDPVKAPTELVLSLSESTQTEPGSSTGLCSTCQHGGGQTGTTSLADRRKGLDLAGVRIEVPRRGELEDESRLSSPASQGFRSPATRLMSLKRILSMGRKTPAASPSSGVGSSGGVGTESDIELGKDESTQGQTRAHTPR